MFRILFSFVPLLLLAGLGCSPPPEDVFVYDLIGRVEEAEEFTCPALALREVQTLTEWSGPEKLPGRGSFRYTATLYFPHDPAKQELQLWQGDRRIPFSESVDDATGPPFWTFDHREMVILGLVKSFFINGTETVAVEPVDGTAQLEIFARGTPAKGKWPIMEVTLDAEQRQRTEVTSSTEGIYRFLLEFPGVKSTLSVSLVNDIQTRDRGDRNLFVNGVRVLRQSTIEFYVESPTAQATQDLLLRYWPEHLGYALMDHPHSLFELGPKDGSSRKRTLGMDINVAGETREAFLLPGPSRIAYPLSIPANATLEFAVTVATGYGENVAWGHGTVRWAWESGPGERTVLFERFFDPEHRPEERPWIEFAIGLQDQAGEQGLLVLETENGFPGHDVIGHGLREEHRQGIRVAHPRVYSVPVQLPPLPDSRPDVIIISIDTLRADHVGCYRYQRNTTPHLDRLAAEGVVFEEAYSPASWTLPAHVSLFTSLYPSSHVMKRESTVIAGELTQLGEWYRDRGYRNGAFVDGVYLSHRFGFARGFDVYQDRKIGIAEILPRALEWWQHQPPAHPRMMFIHFYDVHAPYGSAEEYQRRFHTMPDYYRLPFLLETAGDFKQDVESGALILIPEDIEHMLALYDGDLYYSDEQLGEFFGTLRERGEWDSTLIAVLSDHGEEFLEHGCLNHGHSVYQELLHVPLIVKFPHGEWAGTRVKELASLIDLLPTLADYLNEEPALDWRGQSLLPLVASGGRGERDAIYAETREEFKKIAPEFRLIVPVETTQGGEETPSLRCPV